MKVYELIQKLANFQLRYDDEVVVAIYWSDDENCKVFSIDEILTDDPVDGRPHYAILITGLETEVDYE